MSEVCESCKAKLRKNLEESPIGQWIPSEQLNEILNSLIESVNKTAASTIPKGPYDPIE